jgi:hypothetical protein
MPTPWSLTAIEMRSRRVAGGQLVPGSGDSRPGDRLLASDGPAGKGADGAGESAGRTSTVLGLLKLGLSVALPVLPLRTPRAVSTVCWLGERAAPPASCSTRDASQSAAASSTVLRRGSPGRSGECGDNCAASRCTELRGWTRALRSGGSGHPRSNTGLPLQQRPRTQQHAASTRLQQAAAHL